MFALLLFLDCLAEKVMICKELYLNLTPIRVAHRLSMSTTIFGKWMPRLDFHQQLPPIAIVLKVKLRGVSCLARHRTLILHFKIAEKPPEFTDCAARKPDREESEKEQNRW